MKTKKSIWIVMLIGVFLFSSNQSFAVSQEIQTAIKTHYRGKGDIKTAKKIFKKVVADNHSNNEDRTYALIFLAILSLRDKKNEQADNYLCQILNLKPEFDPDLSVGDITKEFKKRFSYLKTQNRCYCKGVKLAALKKQLEKSEALFLDKSEALFNQWIIKNAKITTTAYSYFQEIQASCPNNPEVLELKRKKGNCDIAEKKLEDCASSKGKDILSCYQEARALCPIHPEFLKCFWKTEKGEFETTTKCQAVEKRLQECENKTNDFTDIDEETLVKIRQLCQYRLRRCQELLDRQVITTGHEETALSCYQEAQWLCPTHSSDIQQKYQEMEQIYINWANATLQKRNIKRFLDGLRKVNHQSPYILELEQRLQ